MILEHHYRTVGLLLTDISDHLPIFSICSDDNSSSMSRETIFVRNKNEANTLNFLQQLESTDWSQIPGYNDPIICYDRFLSKFSQIYNTCFALKTLKRKDQLRKPWLSKGLLKSVKRKNKLYKQYLSDTSAKKEALYKEYRNKLNHSLRIAKRLYYDKKLNESKNNMRATWRVLNDLIYKKKPKLKSKQSFKADEIEITNPVAIANKFCQYFSNVGPNLAKGIQSSISHKNFLSGSFNQSIFLTLATESEIIAIAKEFQLGKAAGYDNIPMSIIKQSINFISSPLAHIVNLSIMHGIVPDQMKIARVVPIFKSGDKAIFSNYRAFSILPCFSKFLERIVYNRIFNYLSDFHILCDNQYGFRKKHSTTHALIDLYDKISSALDHKEYAVGVFLDLSKAVDTVNHEILFDKLYYYGIRGLALDWVESFFTKRTQFVEYNGSRSTPHKIHCGVPQGSILGPLFFILYIKDLNNATNLDSILFADDTNLFISHKDPDFLISTLNCELIKLSTWFRARRLSLNLTKTNFMEFRPRQI